MAINVFISYSHKDEQLKDSFEEHLSGLIRSGKIKSWNDRKILPGQDWSNEISENLKESQIILFLISSSFINSDYCVNIEVKTALEMHNSGQAKLIPIVVRPVVWNDSELAKLQGLPKDAHPITSWDNQDEAWVNVVEGIKLHIEELPAQPKQVLTANNSPQITSETNAWLEDTEIILSHRMVNKVKLSDIYVVPDMEFERDSKSELLKIKSALDLLKSDGHHIISGEEQQGKTSLLKFFYSEFLKTNFLPIFLDGSKIKKSDVDLSLSRAIQEQYIGLSLEQFLAHPKKVVLIDNVDETDLNNKFRGVFLEGLNSKIEFTILTCHNSFSYVAGEVPALDAHDRCELLGLGNKKREEIAKKWICLGVEESISDTEMYAQCDDLKEKLNAVIKKNIVPPKPIYILMLLQWFEANAQLNLELTSYGHCYQQLIYKSFEKAKIARQDFEKHLNVLTELSWAIFCNQSDLNDFQINTFFAEYSKVYLGVDKTSIIEKLTAHSVLSCRDHKTGFKYPYIYYFFVGKKIAESYADSEEIRKAVEIMLGRLHREDIANILIFITHHTKDSWVLNEIKDVLNGLFNDHEPATLRKEKLVFMDEFMKKIPELILEQREIQAERDAHNSNLDDIERSEEESGEPLYILANINKTFKGMEIAGQIIRNRHASLTRDALSELADTGASSGLRFLEYFLKISDAAKNEIIKFINSQLAEHPNTTNQEIEKHAEHTYMHLTYGVINGVVRKIASSIGSKEALEIYSSLAEAKETPAFLLIKQAIELQFHKAIYIDSVRDCSEKLQNNPVCQRILREMVIQHIYMFPVDYKEKQQLSALLGISVKNQRQMDRSKLGKG